MFGLIRLVFLCAVTFVVGVFYERSNAQDACETVGGNFSGGLCTIEGSSIE